MLVLTVKKMEFVQFTLPDGRTGKVSIQELRENGARVGFEFPSDVEILRQKFVDTNQQGEQNGDSHA